MMRQNEAQRLATETTSARQKAEALLAGLMEAKADADRRLAADRRHDAFKAVTGRSAMENAIASTKRMIECLDEAVSIAQHDGMTPAGAYR